MSAGQVELSAVRVGIAVGADGRLHIVLLDGGRVNACYFPVEKEKALTRVLPEVLDEALALAQSGASGSSTTR